MSRGAVLGSHSGYSGILLPISLEKKGSLSQLELLPENIASLVFSREERAKRVRCKLSSF